ncbi:hypothetical protein AMJ52_09910 [candidate division TA06 bacterium DG_78]|uniref:Putative zinc-finger domain-containing protein n=1 Tax=candidate division TA06 bacterium DG_78 TaxID=1703772 RepID=A0A0S7Y8C3_UNCT6|nr:MAG: hypothetical protein AMJ52_09910 [candidate division TA06 bacterium DG_78]
MKCEKIKKYVEDYLLDELEQSLEIKVNEHLSKCSHCQKDFAGKETLINLLRDSLKFQPSHKVYKRIHKTVQKGSVREKSVLQGLPRHLVYATAAFLLGVALMRTIDTIMWATEQHPQVEIRYEEPEKVYLSDTVQFYSAPPKHLARML